MISNKKTVKLNNFVPSLQFTENSFHDLVVYHCKTVFQAKSNKVKQNYFMLLASSPRLSRDMAQDRAPHITHMPLVTASGAAVSAAVAGGKTDGSADA